MLWFLFSIIVVLISAVLLLGFFLLKNFQMLHSLTQSLLSQNQNLVNLAASKDLQAYSQIQQTQSMEIPSSNNGPVALDDISVAQHLQQQYKDAGMDPMQALSQDDFLEFGGMENFRV